MYYVLEPLYKIFTYSIGEEKLKLEEFLKQVKVYLHKNDFKLNAKPLLKTIFKKIFPSLHPLVDAISSLPSARQGLPKKLVNADLPANDLIV